MSRHAEIGIYWLHIYSFLFLFAVSSLEWAVDHRQTGARWFSRLIHTSTSTHINTISAHSLWKSKNTCRSCRKVKAAEAEYPSSSAYLLFFCPRKESYHLETVFSSPSPSIPQVSFTASKQQLTTKGFFWHLHFINIYFINCFTLTLQSSGGLLFLFIFLKINREVNCISFLEFWLNFMIGSPSQIFAKKKKKKHSSSFQKWWHLKERLP